MDHLFTREEMESGTLDPDSDVYDLLNRVKINTIKGKLNNLI
jgi:hypothetical protein